MVMEPGDSVQMRRGFLWSRGGNPAPTSGTEKGGGTPERGGGWAGGFGVGGKDVVAGLKQCEIDQRNCGLATGGEDGVFAGFEFADACGEFEGGGRAVEAVGVADFVLVPGVFDGAGGGENGGGAAVGGRCKRF